MGTAKPKIETPATATTVTNEIAEDDNDLCHFVDMEQMTSYRMTVVMSNKTTVARQINKSLTLFNFYCTYVWTRKYFNTIVVCRPEKVFVHIYYVPTGICAVGTRR